MLIPSRIWRVALSALAAVVLPVLLVNAQQAGNPNSFNRLMTPPSERNRPPPQDGIHDPNSPAVQTLQPPKTSFADLPPGQSGNYVDWVKAIQDGKIQPRFDRVDPKAEPLIMDLNIVREVKGTMPNVVYPHKQHTEWLDCSNCHPAIFIPQKGANKISMASILLGEACGVCHGKVAFPVAECRRCHSQVKGGTMQTSTPPAAPAKTN
ncbi:MAG: c(7)-type cytochrome triheme domain-containing protein [Gammaproteobacteria bacterium]